jgi:hypothetical protein
MGSWLLRYSPHLVGADALAESKMISAKEKQRQLGEAVASGQWLVISENLKTSCGKIFESICNDF